LGGSNQREKEVLDMDPFDDSSDEQYEDFPESAADKDMFENGPEDPEALAAAIEEAQFAAENAGFQGSHVPYPGEAHGKRRLPSLRIGFPGRVAKEKGKRQFEDDLGLEDLGFLDGGEATDAEEEALEEELEEILQEIEAEESEGYDGVEDGEYDGVDEGYGGADEGEYPEEDYPETTSTSSSRVSKPTSAPKRPSAGLENGVADAGSKTAVPVYRGAITYAVPKTGYYCVGTSLSPFFPSTC
jgi:hypothetical protein